MKLPYSVFALPVLSFVLFQPAFAAEPQSTVPDQKTRIAIVGLDHDHVWELLKYIANEPQAELVAIANAHPDLVDKAKSQVPASVKFYPDYVQRSPSGNSARVRQAPHPLLSRKAGGDECCRRSRDAAAGRASGNQVDGELLER